MLQEGVRGNRRSKDEELRIISDIQKLLPDKDDYEIMDLLALPNSTYYRYKSKIYREARKIWKRVTKESLEYRALMIKKALEVSIRVNEQIALDPKQLAKDRIEASQILVEAEEDMFLLFRDGPELIKINAMEDRIHMTGYNLIGFGFQRSNSKPEKKDVVSGPQGTLK